MNASHNGNGSGTEWPGSDVTIRHLLRDISQSGGGAEGRGEGNNGSGVAGEQIERRFVFECESQWEWR